MRIIYFHGFASGPSGQKIDMLRDAGFKVAAPQIDIDPEIAEQQLIKFICDEARNAPIEEKCVFVGTSLGGFWAARMGELFEASSILINPAMHPEETLKQFIGSYENYVTGEQSVLTAEIVEKYKKYSSEGSDRYRAYFVSKSDAIVDAVVKISDEGIYFLYDSCDHRGLSLMNDVIKYIKSL